MPCMVSPKLAAAAGKETLLMSKELEERIDMTAYRDPPVAPSRPIRVTVAIDGKTFIEGKLVRFSEATPHPVKATSMQVVSFIASSSDALGLRVAKPMRPTVTMSDGNIEAEFEFRYDNVTRPCITLESIKDSDDVLVTLMAW